MAAYVIRNKKNNKYLSILKGNLVYVENLIEAHKFSKLQKVHNLFASPPPILNNEIWGVFEVNSKALGKEVFEYNKTVSGIDSKKTTINISESTSEKKNLSYTENKCKDIDFDELENLFSDTGNKISDFNKWLEGLVNQEVALTYALSKIDLEKADIEHAIELGVFNASEGYMLCKQLQEIMQRRRVIKDALYLLPSIRETHKALTPFVKHINERTYTPKVLKTLKIREIKSTKKKNESDH